MLKTDRICTYIFIAAFAMLIPSVKFVMFFDELAAAMLGAVAVLDCIVNRSWRRYRMLWIIMGVITFYAVYSLLFMRFNTPGAIALDWVIQLKPFIPFLVFLAVKPTFTGAQLSIIRIIALANAAVCTVVLLIHPAVKPIIGHVSMGGSIIIVSAVVYALASRSKSGSAINTAIIVTMLCAGLLCTRARYFGEFITAIFLLFFYRPGMLSRSNRAKTLIFVIVPLLIVAAAWHKIDYYFISGSASQAEIASEANADVLESFARPVLYATGALVIADYIPFGSGLASFASFASSSPYSQLYHEYGISAVYGLSPSYPAFICDAFYPSLAQFGIVGIALFAWFWIKIASMLRRLLRANPQQNRLDYACGWIIVLFVLIESIASTTFVQTVGMCAMMLLGVVCAQAPAPAVENREKISSANTFALNGI